MISLRGYHTRVSHVCDFIASSSRSRVLCNFAFEKKNEFTRKEEGGGGKKKAGNRRRKWDGIASIPPLFVD